jgi:hypothetical protein
MAPSHGPITGHRNSHFGYKDFECSHCHKKFTRDWDRKRHEKTHAKKKESQGEVCGTESPKRGMFTNHHDGSLGQLLTIEKHRSQVPPEGIFAYLKLGRFEVACRYNDILFLQIHSHCDLLSSPHISCLTVLYSLHPISMRPFCIFLAAAPHAQTQPFPGIMNSPPLPLLHILLSWAMRTLARAHRSYSLSLVALSSPSLVRVCPRCTIYRPARAVGFRLEVNENVYQ